MQFSVLMSIYLGTEAKELDSCLESLADQSLKPDQIVLVRDGPVDTSVEETIDKHLQKLPIHSISFPQNRGLGLALRDGLLACDHEIVARVDSDDWSVPERFENQIDYLKNYPSTSVVGGWLREYYESSVGRIGVVRETPSHHNSIERIARRRNPINHPTVMFKKSHVLAAGNYADCLLFEDYFLWARMLMSGFILANLPSVLVETKVDKLYFVRRGGIGYVKKELVFVQKLKTIGFLSTLDTIFFIASRLLLRVSPLRVRQMFYKGFLRKS